MTNPEFIDGMLANQPCQDFRLAAKVTFDACREKQLAARVLSKHTAINEDALVKWYEWRVRKETE